jgi:hypothetical protein
VSRRDAVHPARRVLPRVEGTETAADLAARLEVHGVAGAGVHRVHAALAGLFPARGLERGRIYAVRGSATISAVYALVAEATRDGAWFAMVDMPRAGLVAADEHGIAMHRVVSVSVPRTVDTGAWSRLVGAIADGIDLVACSSPRCGAADARRLAARVRASGAVLFVVGNPGVVDIDATVNVATRGWSFDAHAHARTVDIECSGRRMPGVRRVTVHLPSAEGRVAAS